MNSDLLGHRRLVAVFYRYILKVCATKSGGGLPKDVFFIEVKFQSDEINLMMHCMSFGLG